MSVDGLQIDRWLKNDVDGYLPDFLEKKERNFGHAKPGTMEGNMIYQYSGKDETKKDKYYNGYRNKKYYDSIDDVKDDYNNTIKPLIKSIVNARDLNEIYSLENSSDYKNFTAKQILRKISVMMSLVPSSQYKNEFVWIYDTAAIIRLANILEVDYDESKTFLENNHLVYKRAKEYAGITNSSSEMDFVKLYDFLWFLAGSGFHTTEFSDFNSINIIFNGAPGTGKTYSVTNGIKKLQVINSDKFKNFKYIQFHPSFSYQDFIEGIKPVGITSGNLDLQVINGVFKEFCIFVKKKNEEFYNTLTSKPNPEKPNDFIDWPHYYFIVDEINRGNLSNVFGETFTLLEQDYRDYDFSGNYNEETTNLVSTALSSVISKLSNSDELAYKTINNNIYFGIPFNIHFIGIMNDVDRSIDAFDLALRRRFKWISMQCDYQVIEEVLITNKYDETIVKEYVNSCKELNELICSSNKEGLKLGSAYEIGHSFFLKIMNIGKITKNNKTELFDTYISGTLKEYIRQVADEKDIDSWLEKAKKAFGI